MLLLLAGLVVFLGSHAFIMARGPRAALVARLGEGGYKAAFSAVSLVGLVLIAVGFGDYRASGLIEVWRPPAFTRHLALLLVWLAFIMIVAAYLPGRIKSVLKHPMLAGVKLWAFAHLIANGDLGSMLLFGSILAWAVAARISVKRRSVAAAHGGPLEPPGGIRNDAVAVAVGTAAFLAFALWLHPVLIGVPVWPGRA
jgi:uncharacterized membrane protein